jgi:hypothetical protein
MQTQTFLFPFGNHGKKCHMIYNKMLLRSDMNHCLIPMRYAANSIDNIWLHRGWYAPCELPRTSSSSALAVGLWIHAHKTSR